mmetsp:Transcript_93979/g.184278  ORF Transcript_93979/g.184278 Transcript_93979/m.184278 type:complete len:221 (-) Transcript_93979:255-917(-)
MASSPGPARATRCLCSSTESAGRGMCRSRPSRCTAVFREATAASTPSSSWKTSRKATSSASSCPKVLWAWWSATVSPRIWRSSSPGLAAKSGSCAWTRTSSIGCCREVTGLATPSPRSRTSPTTPASRPWSAAHVASWPASRAPIASRCASRTPSGASTCCQRRSGVGAASAPETSSSSRAFSKRPPASSSAGARGASSPSRRRPRSPSGRSGVSSARGR